MATTMVLFLTSPAYGALGKDLEARGLEFAHADLPTGVLMPDGRHAILSKDRQKNVAAFEALAAGDGQAFAREMDKLGADAPFLFSLLAVCSGRAISSRQCSRRPGSYRPPRPCRWFGDALVSGRAHLETTYRSEEMQALFVPGSFIAALDRRAPIPAKC